MPEKPHDPTKADHHSRRDDRAQRAGASAARARDVPKVATGFVANVLCSETFVSGQPIRSGYLRETTAAMPGASLITWAMDYKVDRARKDVTVTLFGFGKSHAVYREGLGCYLDHGDAVADMPVAGADTKPAPLLLPEIAGPAVVAPATPQLAAALDRAFAEPDAAAVPPHPGDRRASRTAASSPSAMPMAYGIDTPILGFSATKSVISALTGILVRKGKLTLDEPAPVAAWQSPDDPRHAITVDHLLRHTAGLALGSSLEASLGSALEPVNRMKFMERDMAAYAESIRWRRAPGSAWNYNDGNFIILSHLIRNAAGGTRGRRAALRAAGIVRSARHAQRHARVRRRRHIRKDRARCCASARDWARFGLLYLNDGVVGGKRILPEGWVNYSASPTPNAWVGIGAGFWTNRGDSFGANYRVEHGWPRDAFFAKGTIGQYVIIIPSERLVIVRLGRSPNWPPEADGVFDLVQRRGRGDRRQGEARGQIIELL